MTKKKAATPDDRAEKLERNKPQLVDNIAAARAEIARRDEAYRLALHDLLTFEASPYKGGRFLLSARQHARRAGRPIHQHEIDLVERIAVHMDAIVDRVLQYQPQRHRAARNLAQLCVALSLGNAREEAAERRRQAARLARLHELEAVKLRRLLGVPVAIPSRAALERISGDAAGLSLTQARAAWEELDAFEKEVREQLAKRPEPAKAATEVASPAKRRNLRQSAEKPEAWKKQALSKRTK